MARSVWKGPYVDSYLLKKAEIVRQSGRNDVIKTWSRRSTILPQFVGLTFGVHNGKKHVPVTVSENMVGHKFGEFSPTRTIRDTQQTRKQVNKMAEKKMNVTQDNQILLAKASAKSIKISPQKANLVLGLIRGLEAEEALNVLEFSNKRISNEIKKILKSAISNAENNHQLDIDKLVVHEALVGKSMVMKDLDLEQEVGLEKF